MFDDIETTEQQAPMMATETTESPAEHNENQEETFHQDDGPAIKPYVQSLTMLDLESCVKLEEATFPPQERCSREKFIYRFSKCGELSIGLFTSANTEIATSTADNPSSPDPSTAATASTAQPVYSGTPARKQILLAQIIATKTDNPTVHDGDMEMPPNWDSKDSTQTSDPSLGHKEHGRTLCIHSLAVLPAFQKKGLARLLMRSYIQRMESSAVADRIAILSHEPLVGFYESLGFENRGPSKAQFGGGDWVDLVLEFKNQVQGF